MSLPTARPPMPTAASVRGESPASGDHAPAVRASAACVANAPPPAIVIVHGHRYRRRRYHSRARQSKPVVLDTNQPSGSAPDWRPWSRGATDPLPDAAPSAAPDRCRSAGSSAENRPPRSCGPARRIKRPADGGRFARRRAYRRSRSSGTSTRWRWTSSSYSVSMRSSSSSICRGECLAGAAHNQLCCESPASRGVTSACRQRSSRPLSIARMNAPGQRRFVLPGGAHDDRAQRSLMHDDQLMVVQPAARKHQQSLPITGPRQFLPQRAHQRTSLWLTQPAKAQRLTGQLLMLNQRRCTPIQGA